MNFSSIDTAVIVAAAVVVAAATLASILTLSIRRYGQRSPPMKGVLQGLRNLVIPFGLLWFLLVNVVMQPPDSVGAKVVQSLFWVSVIWVGTGAIKLLFFTQADETTWRARVPGLFINLTQVTLIVVGVALVIAGVWNQNLGALLATLGVGSLVVGLALQDTLGNLFAGIALLFERPFSTGDWIGVGELEGRVVNINWRAVHIETRERDLHVVPNSVLGKEAIHNFSRPSTAHGVIKQVGFSYDDPPNDVKRMLRTICEDVNGILRWGVSVRTIGYQDFSINYEVRFFIEDYLRQPEIEEDFMTRVWYATRRNGFTIPFPIRTVHHQALPPKPIVDKVEAAAKTLAELPLFHDLEPTEVGALSERAKMLEFAAGDAIVREGQPGDSMYLIDRGSVIVKRSKGARHTRTLAELNAGAYFGEMSLLTGEPRTASVIAKTDARALLIPKDALRPILEARPKLVESFADVVEERRRTHDDPTEFLSDPTNESIEMPGLGVALVGKIRSFFGLGHDGD